MKAAEQLSVSCYTLQEQAAGKDDCDKEGIWELSSKQIIVKNDASAPLIQDQGSGSGSLLARDKISSKGEH